MPSTPLLKVFANPFCAELDHEGRPHGHLQYEPDIYGNDAGLRWVGCRVTAKQLREAKPMQRVPELWDHAWVYSLEPSVVPATHYYLDAIRSGALLAADAETQRHATGSADHFACPKFRLAQLAEEREAIPALELAPGADPDKRDIEAEWDAFVGKAADEEKARRKAISDKAEAAAKDAAAKAEAIAKAKAAAASAQPSAPPPAPKPAPAPAPTPKSEV